MKWPDRTAGELAEAIAARKVTAAEAVGSVVARMRATNGKLTATVAYSALSLLAPLGLALRWL